MKLAIFGSRSLHDERVKIIILEAIKKYEPEMIVTSGEPEGVCQMAREISRQISLPLKIHWLNFKYLRGAFEHRSKAVYRDCDHVILIHDGISKGTRNEKILAEKMNIPYSYTILEKTEFKESIGFDIQSEWDVEDVEFK